MTVELVDLVDGEGNVCPNVKNGIIKEFCESPAGGNWFYSLTMTMISCALTELVDDIRYDNPGVTMPSVVDIYYNKEVKCPILSWDASEETKVSGSVSDSGDKLSGGDDEENESSLVGSGGSVDESRPKVSGGDKVPDEVLLLVWLLLVQRKLLGEASTTRI
ncbi:hypothetical protein M9H77_30754 [Catharanthus roseus]|uniref:Uncharacterized protein n=1 Tax=Catharanthus roseus TaxID=4058 RepID=A0ACC0A0S7_CATRO|nr:hypothetical protein M9H77_30754 [Catharanthus roseus]